MNKLIKLTCWSTILVMSLLLILTGMRGMGEKVPQLWIDSLASSMYTLFIITSLLVIYREYQLENKFWLFLFALPIDVLIISLILPYFDIKMHTSILFLFDVYVLILFSFYLGRQENRAVENIPSKSNLADEN